MFLAKQPIPNREKYVDLLKSMGALSRLFSDNKAPYLSYRAHENIFCLTLDASNESRGDVSVDAVQGETGIGLKTFLYKNSQFEKIAEFNKLLTTYKNLSGMELALAIAKARNERLSITERIYDLNKIIYHCVARDADKFIVYEEDMSPINIENLIIDREDATSIEFHDESNLYKFNYSKSTLFKKFIPNDIFEFPVSILDDPFSVIAGYGETTKEHSLVAESTDSDEEPEIPENCVILPLYSEQGEVHVQEKSALNQWNAAGRKRAFNEVYISIPIWIHQVFEGFFPPKDSPFDLRLPNGKILSAKVCQENNKALMSNPNADLGEWLLRKVLNLEEGKLLTYEMLVNAGIDSVMVTKKSDDFFEIDFKAIGTYDEFKTEYKQD